MAAMLIVCAPTYVQAQEQVNWLQSNVGASGVYTRDTLITAGGGGTGLVDAATSDNFSYARTQTFVPVNLKALVSPPSAGFAGIQVRKDAGLAYSPHVSIGLTAGNVVKVFYRTADSGENEEVISATTSGPTMFRIVETATTESTATFVASYSTDGGNNFTQVGSSITIPGTNFFEGIAIASGTSGSLATTSASQLSLTQAQLDFNFLVSDIGSPGIPGQVHFDYSYSGGGAGNGVASGGSADSLNMGYFPITGDFDFKVKVESMTSTDANALAGLAVRDSTWTPNGAQATVGVTHSAGIKFTYRATAGGTNSQATLGSVSAPTWLRMRRSGNSVSCWNSANGQTSWTQVGTTQTITLPSTAFVGFATTSGGVAVNKAVFSNVTVWSGQVLEDIGSPGATGTVSYDGSTDSYTTEGAGTGVGANAAADKYSLVTIPVTGDRTTITANIASIEDTDVNAFGGLALLYNATKIATMGVTRSNGAKFMWRGASDSTTTTTSAGVTAPRWLRLVVTYDWVTGYISTNGTDWTQVAKGQVGLGPTPPTTYKLGFLTSSAVNGTLATAVYDKVSIAQGLSPTSIDIGTTGTYSYDSGTKTYTVSGGGMLGGPADAGVSPVLGGANGNIELMGKVASQTNTNAYSGAGFIIRENKEAGARFAAVTVSPSNGIVFTCRTTSGQAATTTLGPTIAAPVWLRLVRSNLAIAAYMCTETYPVNWQLVGKCSMTLPAAYYAGFLTTNNTAPETATTATFTNVYYFNKVPQRNSDMLVWLRSDAGITTGTYGSWTTIADWKDQSFNGNNANESTASLQPSIYSANSTNNLPFSYFAGSGQPEKLSFNPSFKNFAGASIFFVTYPDTSTNLARHFEFAESTGNNAIWTGQGSTSGSVTFHVKDGSIDSSVTATTGSLPIDDTNLLEVIHNGGNPATGTIYVNGVQKATSSTLKNIATVQRTHSRMGANYLGTGNYYNGGIGELIVYGIPVNSTTRADLETYFYNKCAITTATQLAAPTLTPRYKISLTTPQSVAMSASADAQIFYTLNGTQPDVNSFLYQPGVPISISENTTLKAIAVQPHFTTSAVTDGRIEFDANAVPPAQPGLVAWFRADIGLTTTGGSPDYCTNWGDLSGADYKANPGADASRPAKVTVSSHSALDFDGSSDYLQITPDLTNWSGATIFIVTNPDSPLVTSDRFFDFGTAASTNSIRLYQSNATGGGAAQIYDGTSGSTVSAASGVVTAGSTQILELLHNGGSSTTATVTIYTNGTQKAQSATMKGLPNIARDSFIGKAFGAANYLNGKVSELIIYNQTLNGTQRTAIINYLKSRYSIP